MFQFIVGEQLSGEQSSGEQLSGEQLSGEQLSGNSTHRDLIIERLDIFTIFGLKYKHIFS